jgi:hypothetical protein
MEIDEIDPETYADEEIESLMDQALTVDQTLKLVQVIYLKTICEKIDELRNTVGYLIPGR